MDYRARLPGALIRRAQQQATASGTTLDAVIRVALELYTAGQLDLAAADPIGRAIGRRGGQASGARLTAEERSAKARVAAAARWR